MDRGDWWATVHKVTKRQTQLKWLHITRSLKIEEQSAFSFVVRIVHCSVQLKVRGNIGFINCGIKYRASNWGCGLEGVGYTIWVGHSRWGGTHWNEVLAGVKGKFFCSFGACHFQPMILTISRGKIYYFSHLRDTDTDTHRHTHTLKLCLIV